ncbi:MAG TPA: hypothetical protein VGL59_26820, partial [Polyangia bacterium]
MGLVFMQHGDVASADHTGKTHLLKIRVFAASVLAPDLSLSEKSARFSKWVGRRAAMLFIALGSFALMALLMVLDLFG